MKLVFEKNVEEIEVKLKIEGETEDFNYIKMIEYLHDGNELEETEYPADISSVEQDKINEMINNINESIEIRTTE